MRVTSVALLAFCAISAAAFSPLGFVNPMSSRRHQEDSSLAARHPWTEGGVVIREDPPDENRKPAGEQGELGDRARLPQGDLRKPATAEPRPKKWLVQTTPRPISSGAESTKAIRNPPVRSDRRDAARTRPPLTRTPGSTPEWAVPNIPITQRAAEAKKKAPTATPKREPSPVIVNRMKPAQPIASKARRAVGDEGVLPTTDATRNVTQSKKQAEPKRVSSPDLSNKKNLSQDTISNTERTASREDYFPDYFSQMNQKISSQPLTQVQSKSVAATKDTTDSHATVLGVNGSVSPSPVANPVNVDNNTSRTKPVEQAPVKNDDILNERTPPPPISRATEIPRTVKPEKRTSTINAPAKKWLSSLRTSAPVQKSASNSSPSVAPRTRKPVRTIHDTPVTPRWPRAMKTTSSAAASAQKPVGKVASSPTTATNTDSKPVITDNDMGSSDSTGRSKPVTSTGNAPAKKWLSSLRNGSEANRRAADPSSSFSAGTTAVGPRNEKDKSSTPVFPNRTIQSLRKTSTNMKSSNATPTESTTTDTRPKRPERTTVEAASNEENYVEKARELERRVSMLREQRRLTEERRQKERKGRSKADSVGAEIKQPDIPFKGSRGPANEEKTTLSEGVEQNIQSNRTSVANTAVSAGPKDSGSTSAKPIGTDPWIRLTWPGTPKGATTAESPSPSTDSPKPFNATNKSKPFATGELKPVAASRILDQNTANSKKKAKQEAVVVSEAETRSILKTQEKVKRESYTNQRALLTSRFAIEEHVARNLAERKLKALEQARVAAELEAQRMRDVQEKAKRESYIKQRALLSTRFEIEEKEARSRRAEKEARVAAELEAQRMRDVQEKAKRESYIKQRALLSTRFEIEEKVARSRRAEKEARIAAELEAQRTRDVHEKAKRESYIMQRALLSTRFEIEEKEATNHRAEEEARVAAELKASIHETQEKAKRKSYLKQRALLSTRLEIEQKEATNHRAEKEAQIAAEGERQRARDAQEKAKRETYLKQRALLAARFVFNRKSEVEESIALTRGVQFQEPILKLEQELQEVQSRIVETERQIVDRSDDWASEDISFALQIAELTNQLQGPDEDTKERQMALQKVHQQRQIELNHELEECKETLADIQRAIQNDNGTCERLAQKLESRMRILDEIKRERDKCRAGNYRLRKQIVSNRIERRGAEERREQEKLDFKVDSTDLEARVMNEKAKLLKLSERLRMERISHEKELSALERQLLREKTKRSNTNLKQERKAELEAKLRMYTDEKKRLEENISYEKRARDVKIRQLTERKESIRKELISLCQGAKDSDTRERQAIIGKYEAELSVVTDLLKRLKSEKQAAADTRQLTDHVNMLKRQRRQEEQDFVRQLTARNNVISDLSGHLPTLKSELQDRDKIIEEYETDFCKIMRQTLKICREYFQGVGEEKQTRNNSS